MIQAMIQVVTPAVPMGLVMINTSTSSVENVATVMGHSMADVDKSHVERMVVSVITAAGSCAGSTLRLHVFQPPYMPQANAPAGYMEFWIESSFEPTMMFTVEFQGTEHKRLGFSALSKKSLQEAAANMTPEEYASVSCFDELWLFACMVAERLSVTKIHMSYGV